MDRDCFMKTYNYGSLKCNQGSCMAWMGEGIGCIHLKNSRDLSSLIKALKEKYLDDGNEND